MQRGARLAVETDPAGAGADLVRVSGNATLNGGAVAHVGAQGDYALNASYTIMEVRGTLSGRFDAVSSDFAFLTPSLAYDYGAGRVSLSLARNDTRMAWTGATRNQRAAAARHRQHRYGQRQPAVRRRGAPAGRSGAAACGVRSVVR